MSGNSTTDYPYKLSLKKKNKKNKKNKKRKKERKKKQERETEKKKKDIGADDLKI